MAWLWGVRWGRRMRRLAVSRRVLSIVCVHKCAAAAAASESKVAAGGGVARCDVQAYAVAGTTSWQRKYAVTHWLAAASCSLLNHGSRCYCRVAGIGRRGSGRQADWGTACDNAFRGGVSWVHGVTWCNCTLCGAAGGCSGVGDCWAGEGHLSAAERCCTVFACGAVYCLVTTVLRP